ncbi:hypothetical protein Tco_1400713 [Tanacetum coccineum]
MHNDIMAAGFRDRPPILATGRYAQWQSPKPATTTEEAVPEHTIVKTYKNVTPEKHAYFDVEAEAIHMILSEIGDDIYSIVDACTTATEMWIAIKRYGESIESYYSRFYKMMNEMQTANLDKESYHKLFEIRKQYQNEVNDIRIEKLARNANPLALVPATQHYPDTYYQAPKSHKSYAPPAKPSSLTRSHATTRTKNWADFGHFAKEYSKTKRAKDYAYHKNKMLLCKKAENDVPLHVDQGDWLDDTDEEPDEQDSEANYMYMTKIQEVLTVKSGPTFDAEPLEHVQSNDDYNVFAIVRQHSEQPESINDTYMVETVDSNVIPNSSNICDNEEQDDQNADEYEDDRVVLANLIANLKLDHDKNKKTLKQLKKANTSLTHKLNEFKYVIEETNDI